MISLFGQGLKAQDLQEMIAGLNENISEEDRYKLLIKVGLNYQNLQAYKKAIYYFDDALKISTEQNIVFENTFLLKNKALCLEELRQYSSAIAIWDEIHISAGKRLDRYENILSLEKLTRLSALNLQYPEAIKYAHMLLDEYEMQGNHTAKAAIYNKLYLYYKKINNKELSNVYLQKCKSMVDESTETMDENELCEISLNLGLTIAIEGDIEMAQQYMARSLQIRTKQKRVVEQADILNYMATLDMHLQAYVSAQTKVGRAIELASSAPDEPKSEKVLMASYKVYCELLLRKKRIKEFRFYNNLYNKSRDRLIEKEQKQNVILLEQQVEIEKKENALKLMQSENKRKEISIRQSELEREKKEREVELQHIEIELLKKSRDLQLTQLLNKDLEQQKIRQLLEIVNQREQNYSRDAEIQILNKDRELQRLTIEKQAHENNLLEMEKKVREEKMLNEIKSKSYFSGLVVMLLLIIAGTIWQITQQRKNNRILAEQNNAIRIARETISTQNEELTAYNINLEQEVDKRTEDLIHSNEQLIRNNQQLEQFGYVVSHNLRGPIARLLGLSGIIDPSKMDAETSGYLEKIVSTSKDLDRIIFDMNNILEVKKSLSQGYEQVNVLRELDNVLQGLSYQLEQSHGQIIKSIPADLNIDVIKPYIESIFHNLISNAIKYARGNPKISIIAWEENEWTVMKFQDSGIGIDMEQYREKLFGLYKRFHLHVEGKGLGLFMVKTQLLAMNGKIEVDSTPNVGTCFTLYFPNKNSC